MVLDAKAVSLIKDKAEKFFVKGKFKDALGTYEQIRAEGKKDPRIFIRIGDMRRKLEDAIGAAEAYKEAVEAFAGQGFIIKAIGVCKMIIQMNPSEEAVQKRLVELYSASNKPFVPDSAVTAGAAEPEPSEAVEAVSGGKPEKKKREFPRAPLFSDLTNEELFDVISKARFTEIKAGATLFNEGDCGDSIFIVVSGALDVLVKDENGKEVLIARFIDSDFFGEFTFFSNLPRTATVRAAIDSELIEITKPDMNGITAKYPRVSRVMFDFYKERVVDRLLARSKLFSPMSPADRKEALKHVSLSSFPRGGAVVREGDPGDTMYLIKEGRATAWTIDGSGERKTVGELNPGDFFGEIALATIRPRVASVTAVTDLQAVVFSRDIVRQVLARYPDIKTILEEVIKGRVSGVMQVKKTAKSEALT